MKNTIILTSILAVTAVSFAFMDSISPGNSKDYTECLVKYNSSWGDPCEHCTYSQDIFQLFFRNECEDHLDALVAVQETDETWTCTYQENIAPQDTFAAYACKGTGKFLRWARKAGDRNTIFPTCKEVNESY